MRLDCTLWRGIAESTVEYCQKGDMVGIKGRITSKMIDCEDGQKRKKTEIIAEKVTFLSTKKKED